MGSDLLQVLIVDVVEWVMRHGWQANRPSDNLASIVFILRLDVQIQYILR